VRAAESQRARAALVELSLDERDVHLVRAIERQDGIRQTAWALALAHVGDDQIKRRPRASCPKSNALCNFTNPVIGPVLNEAGCLLLAGLAFEVAGDCFGDGARSFVAFRINATNKAFVDEAGIDGIDQLFGQRCFGKALLVAALAPIILDIPVVPPRGGVAPIAGLLQDLDDFTLRLCVEQRQAEVPNLAIGHVYIPPVL
jgi:hypothetical protein